MNKIIFKIRFLSLIILSGILITNNFAQNTNSDKSSKSDTTFLQIGDKRINTSRIQSETDKFLMFRIVKGDTKIHSLLTRTIEFDRKGKNDLIVVTQRYDKLDGVDIDISSIDRQTLKPVSYSSKLTNQTESFEFLSEEAKGIITDKEGKKQEINVPLKESVFNAVVETELIQSLPLAKGKSFTYRLYNPGKQFSDIKITVLDSELLQTADGQLDTWIISFDGTPVPIKIWVSKKNHKLIKRRVELPNGDEFWQVRLYG